jgi:HD superfamily phosphohydrolase YqeK
MRFVEQVTTPMAVHTLAGRHAGDRRAGGSLWLDVDLAKTIAILHDASKTFPGPARAAHRRRLHSDPTECENNYVLYFHGPVGAYFVQKELGIQTDSYWKR